MEWSDDRGKWREIGEKSGWKGKMERKKDGEGEEKKR